MPRTEHQILSDLYIATTTDGKLLIRYPRDCSPYISTLSTVITTPEDARDVVNHLNEWLNEGLLTRVKFAVYNRVVQKIADSDII